MIRKTFGIAVACSFMSVGAAHAENRNFNFLSPSFGGNPGNGAYLFGLAQTQQGATANEEEPVTGGIGGGGTADGGDIGGPTIVIPITTGQGAGPDITTGATATEADN